MGAETGGGGGGPGRDYSGAGGNDRDAATARLRCRALGVSDVVGGGDGGCVFGSRDNDRSERRRGFVALSAFIVGLYLTAFDSPLPSEWWI